MSERFPRLAPFILIPAIIVALLIRLIGLANAEPGHGEKPAVTADSGRTFTQSMKTAPFPYEGKYADTGTDFFDHLEAATKERFHTNRYGQRFSEKEHYQDASVIFHFSPGFDPKKPFKLVVFFHGNQSSAADSFKDFRLGDQLDRSGRNLILIVPQLARQAADSSPGKFFREGAFKAFLDDVADLLETRFGAECRERLRKAPILLAAFSGGYKSVAYVLSRGGATSRIKAVLLLDALFENVEQFTDWLTRNTGRRTLVLLAGKGGSSANNGRMMTGFLRQHGFVVERSWPETFGRGRIYVVEISTGHLKIPVAGPPELPLARFLKSLEEK